MTQIDSKLTIEELDASLDADGFQRVRLLKGYLVYEGQIRAEGECLKAELLMPSDLQLRKPPTINLLELPDDAGALPHIFPIGSPPSKWNLCYAGEGTSWFINDDPASHIRGCVSEAQKLFGKILRGELDSEVGFDFNAYWGMQYPIRVDVERGYSGGGSVVQLTLYDNEKILCVTDNEERTRKAWSNSTAVDSPHASSVIHLENPPLFDVKKRWPPESFKEFSYWLKYSSPVAYDTMVRIIDSHLFKRSSSHIFVFTHERAWFGVKVDLHSQFVNMGRHTKASKILLNSGLLPGVSKFYRCNVIRIDHQYLLTRAGIDRSPLTDKRILLVGCGTLGGYVAHSLVKAGAGDGVGQLGLVDSDLLMPGNLHRHILGKQYLTRNKAKAMKHFLDIDYALHNITSHNIDIAEMENLEEFDILIDATGDQTLSLEINRLRLASKAPTVLHAWIEGAGLSAQAFLAENDHACMRCLYDTDGSPIYSANNNKSEDNPFVQEQGCSIFYLPFGSSISMQAAGMVAGMVVEWAQGKVRNRLRTIRFDLDQTRDMPPQNPTIVSGCKNCQE